MTCEELVETEMGSAMDILKDEWTDYIEGKTESPEFGYGLEWCPDLGPGARYFCLTLSGGGPSEEIRYFTENPKDPGDIHHVEYWYMDWFDGACRKVTGDDFDLLKNIYDYYRGDL